MMVKANTLGLDTGESAGQKDRLPRARAPPAGPPSSRGLSRFPSTACRDLFPRRCSLQWDRLLESALLGPRDDKEVAVRRVWWNWN